MPGIADKQYGRVLESGTGPLNYTVREPLGVVAHLLAWNTPSVPSPRKSRRHSLPETPSSCALLMKPR
jgi:acyl-CoA reductase-like NAD-dependent aldehyde dehydrogenase